MNTNGMNDPGPPNTDDSTGEGVTAPTVVTDDEGLLEHLADLAREERRDEASQLDERWDALAAGTLDDESVAALRALADQSPEHARAWEAFQPLGEAFQDRVLAKLGGAEARRATPPPEGTVVPWPTKSTAPGTAARDNTAAETNTTAKTSTAARASSRRRGWRRAAWVPLAAAAALGALWLRPPSVQPLPEYQVSMQGLESLRSAGGSTLDGSAGEDRGSGEDLTSWDLPRYAPGSRFELVLVPSTRVDGPLAVDLWHTTDAGPTRLDLDTEISETGSARLVGIVGDERFDLPLGPSTLWLVVRRGKNDRRPERSTVAAWSRGEEVPEGTLFERLDLIVVPASTAPEAWAEPPPEDPG